MAFISALVFKNGYAMVTRNIDLPLQEQEEGVYTLTEPPSRAVHGTFWIDITSKETNDSSLVKSIETKESTKEEQQQCDSIPMILAANVGQTLTLHLKAPNGEHKISGTLLELSGQDYSNSLTVLQTNEGSLVIPVKEVWMVEVASGTHWNKSLKVPKKINSLHIHYRKAKGPAQLCIRYLTYNLTWAPSYKLNLATDDKDKTLHMHMKSVVLNDTEDLQVDNLSCVAGFPNMKFASVIDPLATRETVKTFLSQLENHDSPRGRPGPGPMAQMLSNAVSYNSVSPTFGSPNAPVNSDSSPDDLYFYRFGSVHLPQNERVYLPVFGAVLPYTDVYHCEIKRQDTDVYNYGHQNRGHSDEFQDVWHAIRIQNNTQVPWTTAPVLLTKGEQFVGQDMISYTPINDTALVNLTKALEVKVSFQEKTGEAGAETKILGVKYQSFTTIGKIDIFNPKKEAITVLLKLSLVGELTHSSVKPTSNVEETRYDVANPSRKLVWEVSLVPGTAIDIEFKYKVLRRY